MMFAVMKVVGQAELTVEILPLVGNAHQQSHFLTIQCDILSIVGFVRHTMYAVYV